MDRYVAYRSQWRIRDEDLAATTLRAIHNQEFGTVSNNAMAVPGDQRTSVRVGLMAFPGYPQSLITLIEAAIRDSGWTAELIEPKSGGPEARLGWPLIVILAGHATGEVLIGVTHAAYDLSARVLAVSEDRDPRVIADVLRSGADDYLPYPFSPEEFKARIQSLVRRARVMNERRKAGQITFDFQSRTISAGPKHLSLSKQEWHILIALLEAEGQPVSAVELKAGIHNTSLSPSNLASTVSRLRRKLRFHNFSVISIDTVRGKGYAARFRRSTDSFNQAQIKQG